MEKGMTKLNNSSYDYIELIEKFGKPIFSINLAKDRKLTIAEEDAGKPSEILIFKNDKNQTGYSVCAKYSKYEINMGLVWAVSGLIEEIQNLREKLKNLINTK